MIPDLLRRWRRWVLLGCLASGAAWSQAEPLRLDVAGWDDPDWRIEATGQFRAGTDRRGLVNLSHPFSPSVEGSHASATQTFTVPSTMAGPLRLSFYFSDNYDGDEVRHTGWLGEEDFRGQLTLKGHRFKQVLVDGRVVWEQDVADPVGPEKPTRFHVDLPEGLEPEREHEVTLRVVDRVGSDNRLEGDVRIIGPQEKGTIAPEDPWAFPIEAYAGDVAFSPASEEAPPGRDRPMRAVVEARHAERWPLAPFGEAVPLPVTLEVQGAAANDEPRPFHGGVPLPRGAATEAEEVFLAAADGTPLPIQARPMNRWPDGSLRWVEVDAVLPANTASVRWGVRGEGDPRPAPTEPVVLQRTPDGGMRLQTGAFQVSVGPTGGPAMLTLENGDATLGPLRGEVEIAGKVFVPVVEEIRAIAEGPLCGEIALTGTMRAGDESFGRFTFRVAVFAGLPQARTRWRIHNDRVETLDVARWELVGDASLDEAAPVAYDAGQPPQAGPLWVRQPGVDRYEVSAGGAPMASMGMRASGWLGASDGTAAILAGVRHFAEQFPCALGYEGGRLHVRFFEPSDELPLYRPHEGEAKRHEVWLGLWGAPVSPESMAAVAASWLAPAVLFDADYHCATGAMGEAYPHDDTRFPELTRFMDEQGAQPDLGFGIRHGIRHWGDSPYGEKHWCNGYYDRQQGFAVEYLMTGGYDWFRRLEATVLHIIDIDICHRSQEHPEWEGAIRSLYADDHSTGGIAGTPWPPGQRTKGTLAYWRYTADDAARNAALGVADSAVRCGRGLGSISVRDHGGVLYCLMAAYDETGDAAYLEAAGKLAHDSLRPIDPRRGTYVECHGNVNYFGGVPWLEAQLAEPLYEYYRCSGDVDAAVAVVGLAESLMTENAVGGDPATLYGYSFNPMFRHAHGKGVALSSYDVAIAPVFLYAYDLTGDEEFLEFGRALFKRTLEDGTVNSVVNCYWNTETLLYFLHVFGE